MERPVALFDLARSEGREEELEAFCRALAFRSAARSLPRDAVLFLNVNAGMTSLPITVAPTGWPAERTVLEILEMSPVCEEADTVSELVQRWRRQGFRIAVDDVGRGFSHYAALLAIRPDIAKIDMELVRGVCRDEWRPELLASIVHTNSDLHIITVAEGIETADEMNELVDLGVEFGQGFFLGPPRREARGSLLLPRGLPQAALDAEDPSIADVEAPGQAAYVVDRARRILRWNEAAAAVSGYPPEAVLGLPCWRTGLDHRNEKGERLCFRACPLVLSMQTGRPQRAVVSMRASSGARHWVEVEVSPVRDRKAKIVGAVERFRVTGDGETTADAGTELGEALIGRSTLVEHLFWRKEIARWLGHWQDQVSTGRAYQSLVDQIPFGAVCLWARRRMGTGYRRVAAKGCDDGSLAILRGLATRAASQGTSWWSAESDGEEVPGMWLRRAVAIPIPFRGTSQAILAIGDQADGRVTPVLVAALEEVAPLLGASFVNADLLASLKRDRAMFRWVRSVAPLALNPQPRAGVDDDEEVGLDWPEFRRFRRGWARLAAIRGGVVLYRAHSEETWAVVDRWGIWEPEEAVLRRWWPTASGFLLTAAGTQDVGGWLPPGHPLRFGSLPVYAKAVVDRGRLIALILVSAARAAAEETDAIGSILDFTALAIVGRHRQWELAWLAEHDALTGVRNRRALEERLERYFAAKEPEPALFVLVDLDRFKTVNDRRGHVEGDTLLKKFAAYATAALRPDDLVARIGGDEFVWVLFGARCDQATERRLAEIVGASPLAALGAGATLGVVQIPDEARSFLEAYRLADRRLYEGKAAGKGVAVGCHRT